MVEIALYDTATFNDSSTKLAIAIGYSSRNQLHCGILHKGNNISSLLHLATHHRLLNSSNLVEFYNYKYVIPTLPDLRTAVIAARCRRIASRKEAIPYGFSYSKTRFSPEGTIKIGEKEVGLTCATFILSVFASCGIEILQTNKWPSRKEDENWQSDIIGIFKCLSKKGLISEEHIQNIEKETEWSRYRPEEVTGGSTHSTLPSPFEYALKIGDFIRSNLEVPVH